MVPPLPADAEFDPAGMLRDLAARLVAAHEAEPGNAPLARELRATLLALAGQRPDEGDPVLRELMGMVTD